MDESSVREIVNALLSPLVSRIEKVEKSSMETALWQGKYGEKIDNLVDLVKQLTSKPQRRWDAIISSVISVVVAFIFAAVVFYVKS